MTEFKRTSVVLSLDDLDALKTIRAELVQSGGTGSVSAAVRDLIRRERERRRRPTRRAEAVA